jgi:hypothetical protein
MLLLLGMKGFFLKKMIKYKYYGNLVDGSKEGIGVVKWNDGSKLIAMFTANKANGLCSFQDSNGSVFNGMIKYFDFKASIAIANH